MNELREVVYATILVIFGLCMGYGIHAEMMDLHSTTVVKGDRLR